MYIIYLMGRDRKISRQDKTRQGQSLETRFKTKQDRSMWVETRQDFQVLWNLDSGQDETYWDFKISRRDGTRQHFPSRLGREFETRNFPTHHWQSWQHWWRRLRRRESETFWGERCWPTFCQGNGLVHGNESCLSVLNFVRCATYVQLIYFLSISAIWIISVPKWISVIVKYVSTQSIL